MNGDKINNYINKKCYDCCHFKKENMELYKLNFPNETVKNIINYSMDELEILSRINQMSVGNKKNST